MDNIITFLDNHRHTEDTEDKPTHLAFGKFRGRFYLNNEQNNKFIKLYTTYLSENNNKSELTILEKQDEYSKILIDIDIKKNIDDIEDIEERLYNQKQIKKLIKLYIKSIRKYCKLDKNDEKLNSYVFEKQKPTIKQNEIKDGFHIVFPLIVVKESIRNNIRNDVIKKIKTEKYNILKYLIPDIDNIIDKAVIKTNGWILYGSAKPDMEPYKLTHIFNSNCDEYEIDFNIMNNTLLINLFSVYGLNKPSVYELKENVEEENKEEVKEKEEDNKENNITTINYNFESIYELIKLLNHERAESYDTWLNGVFAIKSFNVNDLITETECHDLIHLFSSLSSNYSKKNVNKFLKDNLKTNQARKEITYKSIHYWAKEDNADNYKIWCKKYILFKKKVNFDDYYNDKHLYEDDKTIDVNNIITTYIKVELNYKIIDHDFARIFHVLYNNFIYSNDHIYYFNGFIWKKQCKINADVVKYVSINLYSYLKKLLNIIIDDLMCNIKLWEMISPKTECEKMEKETQLKLLEYEMSKVNTCIDSLSILKKDSSRKGIITSIQSTIINNNIIFDSYYPNYIAFTNTIYDLKNKCFIEPKPKYYMSMCTKYEYKFYKTKDEIDEQNKKINEINKLLDSIFTDKETKDYYLMLLSQGMGGNLTELFTICTGSGGNGKSLLHEFFLSMLGEYGYNLPNQVLSQTLNNTGGPNPVLANMHLKRFILASEPEAEKRLKSATIKELTGKVDYNARTLHETNTDKILAMTLFLECNEKPLIDAVDGGMVRRLRVINFNSKFLNKDEYDIIINEIDNSNDIDDNEKKKIKSRYGIIKRTYKDKSFKEEYRQALFEILINYYNKYENENEKIPQLIKDDCKIYLELSGDIIPFINDNYYKPDDYKEKLTEASKYKVSLVDLFNLFKSSDYYINMTKAAKRDLNKSKFQELMIKHYPIDFRTNKDKTYFLFNYTIKQEENIKSELDNDFIEN
jgi:phage/plasmid-associated DNA primase